MCRFLSRVNRRDKHMRRHSTIRRTMITRWLSVLSILAGLLCHGTAWPISYELHIDVDLVGRETISKSFTGTERSWTNFHGWP